MKIFFYVFFSNISLEHMKIQSNQIFYINKLGVNTSELEAQSWILKINYMFSLWKAYKCSCTFERFFFYYQGRNLNKLSV